MSDTRGSAGPKRVDPDRARASVARLMEIYGEISEVADDLATRRCPYKDAGARCTAQFPCRNQYFKPESPDEPAICTGSDKLDYRKAWETG